MSISNKQSQAQAGYGLRTVRLDWPGPLIIPLSPDRDRDAGSELESWAVEPTRVDFVLGSEIARVRTIVGLWSIVHYFICLCA